MELLVFGGRGTPIIFFPTRTARFYDYENWRIIDAIKDKIESGKIQVICVDSVDIESFYAPIDPRQKIERHLQYERYILDEVIPFVQSINHNDYLTVAGCSLGGYHAMNIGLRHPAKFRKIVGLSARYDLTLSDGKFPDLFDGYVDKTIYLNNPSMFLPKLSDERILSQIRKLAITFAVGREDPFFENNCQLSDLMKEKNIHHEFYIWEGEAHRPRHWRHMVQWYL